jgi:hypothetical protein
MPAFLAVPLVMLGAWNVILTAIRQAASRAPPNPDLAATFKSAARLPARRAAAMRWLGRRWLLHPDNKVQRKCSP